MFSIRQIEHIWEIYINTGNSLIFSFTAVNGESLKGSWNIDQLKELRFHNGTIFLFLFLFQRWKSNVEFFIFYLYYSFDSLQINVRAKIWDRLIFQTESGIYSHPVYTRRTDEWRDISRKRIILLLLGSNLILRGIRRKGLYKLVRFCIFINFCVLITTRSFCHFLF